MTTTACRPTGCNLVRSAELEGLRECGAFWCGGLPRVSPSSACRHLLPVNGAKGDSRELSVPRQPLAGHVPSPRFAPFTGRGLG
ncbi:hypothetical protein RCCGE510_22219 [Rhizobium sp. CCGE 510]|nr:hypothetical protein RCCGE510_22219 [Rhizobium sp. CCGE 510]